MPFEAVGLNPLLRMLFSAALPQSYQRAHQIYLGALKSALARIDVGRDESPEDRLYEKEYVVRSPITIKHYIT